jgi:hypothetical protein
MKRVRFLTTNGPYLEALIEVEGQVLCVMDEFSVDERSLPKQGDEVEFEFTASLFEDEAWEEIFAGNPEQKKGLEQVDGWRYIAYGQIISIAPVQVDCGVLTVEDVVHTNDSNVVGKYVRFTISRLGGYAYAI